MTESTSPQKCAECGKVVYAFERFDLEDNVYHNGCFKCNSCGVSLMDGSRELVRKKPYCQRHAEDAKAKPTLLAKEISPRQSISNLQKENEHLKERLRVLEPTVNSTQSKAVTLIEKQISQLQIQIRTQEESIKVLQSEGGDVGRTQTELQYLNNKLNMLKLRRKQQKPISSEDETKQLRVRVSTLTAELFGERNKISDFELEISSLNEMVEKQKCDCESAASSAVRYKSMYMQLLDALEVEGVTVHVDGFGETSPAAVNVNNDSGSEAESFSEEEDENFTPQQEGSEADINEDGLTAEDIAAAQVSVTLKRDRGDLPVLEGFLEKKSPTFGVGWQRRWIVVKDFHIFYCRDRISLENDADVVASKKFLNCISLMVVQSVHASSSKSKRKLKQFEITARDPRSGDMRSYLWRASSEEERTNWVEGLNKHRDHLMAVLQYISLNKDKSVSLDVK